MVEVADKRHSKGVLRQISADPIRFSIECVDHRATLPRSEISLLAMPKFPVTRPREIPSNRPKSDRISSPGCGRSRRFRANSLYFPCNAGIRVQRSVRPRLRTPPHSHVSPGYSHRARRRTEKFPRFRGVLAEGPQRNRTGESEFRADEASAVTFFSVGKCHGPDSPQIRAAWILRGPAIALVSSGFALSPDRIIACAGPFDSR